MKNARRPDVFNQDAVIEYFRDDEGLAASHVAAIVSGLRFLIPLLISEMKPEELVELVKRKSPEFGLKADNYWQYEMPYIVKWAIDWLEEYKSKKQC